MVLFPQLIRTECLLLLSVWHQSGLSALVMTSVSAGCAPGVGVCLGDITSPLGLRVYSIL